MILALTRDQATKLGAIAKAAGTDQLRALHGMQLRWGVTDDGEHVEVEGVTTNLHVTVIRGFDIPMESARVLEFEQKGSVIVRSAKFFADVLKEACKTIPIRNNPASQRVLIRVEDDTLQVTTSDARFVYDVALAADDGMFPALVDFLPEAVAEAYKHGRRDLAALNGLRFDGFLPRMALVQLKTLIDSTGDSLAKSAPRYPFFLIPPSGEEAEREHKRWAFMSVRKDGWWLGLISPVRA